jgi:hypothetical protein
MKAAGLKIPGALVPGTLRILTDSSGAITGLMGPDGKQFLVVSSSAPSNSDGRPDGTIYIQTA